MLKPMNARMSSHVMPSRCICIGSHGLFCITVCSTLFHYVWCKYSSKTSSGDLGMGTVGPTEDMNVCIVGVTKLVDHTGGNVCVEETVDGAGGNVCVEGMVKLKR